MSITHVVVFAICFFASTIGAICGIGGGVIIKPVLDATGLFPVATINFLSGCTVLSMTLYSVIRASVSGSLHVEKTTGTPLAIGAAVGGILGKQLFGLVESLFANPDQAGVAQAVALGVITLGTLVYTLRKDTIKTLHVQGSATSAVIGCALGIMSSFLGIGGGPINLVVLYYLYNMQTKKAAQSSLYIIMFSQGASTLLSLATTDFVAIGPWLILGMVVCGIMGGMAGRAVNAHIDAKRVDKLFIGLMAAIILICVYNALRLSGVVPL